MGTTSTIHAIPVPVGTDGNAVPAHIAAVVASLEGGSIERRLSQAEIDALAPSQKPAGLKIYNQTVSRHQEWTGAAWVTEGSSGWADFTPTVKELGGPDLFVSAGAHAVRWCRVGDVVHYAGTVQFAAGGVGLALTVSTPVATVAGGQPWGAGGTPSVLAGQGVFIPASGGAWLPLAVTPVPGYLLFVRQDVPGYVALEGPFAAGDRLAWTAAYEVAP